MIAHSENETPAGFLQQGSFTILVALWTTLTLRIAKRLQVAAYFAQQGILIGQQPPPPQQSAELEVALAVPTSARAAMIIKRYFMESSC